MTLINFEALYDTQKYSICFAMDSTFDTEEWFGVTIRRFNRETQVWEENGEVDEQNTDTENGIYCQWVTKTGLFAPFEELDERAERLYRGFILYVMFALDAYLIVAVIIAFCRKGSRRKINKNQSAERKSVLNDKEYSGVQTEGHEDG